MNYLLKVCLVAITLTLCDLPASTAQSACRDAVPVLKKGISVELPCTTSAMSVPEADKLDALVVTITHDGSAYLGVIPISTAELTQKLKAALLVRAEKDVYIKADARASYAHVVRVLDSLHTAEIDGVTLLTSQPDAQAPGTVLSPKGLEMRIVAPRLHNGSSSNLF
jgi:biopolymer transport protein TolR